MRTTLTLDDDVFRLIKYHAESRSISLGKATSELVRRGLTVPRPTRMVNGLLVFDLPTDSPTISSEVVQALEAAEQ